MTMTIYVTVYEKIITYSVAYLWTAPHRLHQVGISFTSLENYDLRVKYQKIFIYTKSLWNFLNSGHLQLTTTWQEKADC